MGNSSVASRRLRFREGLLATLACWVVLVLLHQVGLFATADLKLLDALYRLRGGEVASERIALVEVDDETIQAFGSWPFPRDAYALLFTALEEAGARAVGVDLLFLDRDRDNPRHDLLLAAVTARQPHLVHAVAFMPASSSPERERPVSEEKLGIVRRHGIRADDVVAAGAASVSLPYDELLRSAHALGHASVAVDRDGCIRRVPLFIRYRGCLVPSLGLRLAALAFGEEGLPEVRSADGGTELFWSDGRRTLFPVDEEGATAIDFAGDRRSFTRSYSMLEVLRWAREEETSKLSEAFDGRIIIVGNTAVGEAATDLGTTPFATATPLLFVHANVLNTVLSESFPRRPPSLLLYGLMALIALLLGWALVVLPLPVAAAVTGGVVVFIGVFQFLLFTRGTPIIPSILPILLPPLSYAALASYRFIFLEKRARERERELDMARGIQRRLLPASPPDSPEFDIFGTNIPALEVGGDYYDWVRLKDGTVVVVVGDVSGKGVGAALLMSHLHASFHAVLSEKATPSEMVSAIHAALYRATEANRFATFILAMILPEDGRIEYCNAGHNPGLVLRDGAMETLEPTGVMIGALDGVAFGNGSLSFSEGEVLVLYSDGVTEAVGRGGAFYGDDRLHDLVRGMSGKGLSAKEIGEAILYDLRAFTHDNLGADDVTLVVVRRRQR